MYSRHRALSDSWTNNSQYDRNTTKQSTAFFSNTYKNKNKQKIIVLYENDNLFYTKNDNLFYAPGEQ